MSENQQQAPAQPAQGNGKRRRMMLTLTAVIAIAAIGYGAYYALYARYYEDTDDAYVAGNVVQITPQVAGTVTGVKVDDTQMVKAGQPLVTLDQTDARVALLQAEANLAQTVRQVRTYFVNNDAYAATVAMRESELAKAQADVKRREMAIATGAVSREELAHAQGSERRIAGAAIVVLDVHAGRTGQVPAVIEILCAGNLGERQAGQQCGAQQTDLHLSLLGSVKKRLGGTRLYCRRHTPGRT